MTLHDFFQEKITPFFNYSLYTSLFNKKNKNSICYKQNLSKIISKSQ